MSTLNRLLHFGTLALAVVALVFGVLLHQRRGEIRQHGDALADVVSLASAELDRNSGTMYGDRLHRDPIAGTDGETVNGGTLGCQNFHELRDPTSGTYEAFDELLREFGSQVADVRSQRDDLARALADVSGVLGDDVAVSELSDVGKYVDSAKEIGETARDVAGREAALIAGIERASLTLGSPLTKGVLYDLDRYDDLVADFDNSVRHTVQQRDDYADVLAQTAAAIDEHDFLADTNKLASRDGYQGEVQRLLADFDVINDQLKQGRLDRARMSEVEADLEKMTVRAADAEAEAAIKDAKIANLDAVVEVQKIRIAELEDDGGGIRRLKTLLPPAKVTKVNYDWNYVLINLGAESDLQPQTMLTIARDQEPICKVRVSKVLANYSVAEILKEGRIGTVIAGDRIVP
jgi:hypothetical protein